MRPNIVWILSDELRDTALNCYGGAWARVHTPNLDALAARGVRFANSFCTSPVCVPSRLCMLTGAHPERTGIYSNEGSWASFRLPVKLPTFTEHLAANGYRTASMGKSHHHADYTPWQEENHDGGSMHNFGLDTEADLLEPILPSGIPSPVGGVFPSDRTYPPDAVTWNALRWLDAHADDETPFLLRVSYLQPHTPVLPPAHYRRMYDPADWPGLNLPHGYGSAYEQAFAEFVGGRRLDHETVQRAQADYHALVTWLDAQVGLVLGMLHTRGLAENTIVVFNADHGASLGENGLFSKLVHAPQSHRVPLIYSWPGHLPQGEVRDDLAQGIDLGPTLCDLAGVPRLDTFEGRSLFSDAPPEAIYSTISTGTTGARLGTFAQKGGWRNGGGWPRRACVRTERFRFDMNIRQDDGPMPVEEEDHYLVDWRADPLERNNLAGDPAYAEVVADLRGKVLAHAEGAVEPDFIPRFTLEESPEFLPPKVGGRYRFTNDEVAT